MYSTMPGDGQALLTTRVFQPLVYSSRSPRCFWPLAEREEYTVKRPSDWNPQHLLRHQSAAVLSVGFCGIARRAIRKTKSYCCLFPKSRRDTLSAGRRGRSTRRTERRLAPRFVRTEEMSFFRVDPFHRGFQLQMFLWRVSHQAAEFRSA